MLTTLKIKGAYDFNTKTREFQLWKYICKFFIYKDSLYNHKTNTVVLQKSVLEWWILHFHQRQSWKLGILQGFPYLSMKECSYCLATYTSTCSKALEESTPPPLNMHLLLPRSHNPSRPKSSTNSGQHIPRISPPAQYAFSPAPVITTNWMELSSKTACIYAHSECTYAVRKSRRIRLGCSWKFSMRLYWY